MVEVITILIFNMAIPTLIPSIIFTILFLTTTIIHLYRSVKTHRTIYSYLFLFSLFRTLAYSIRIAWSQEDYSKVYALSSTSLLTISFFLMFLAIFTLLTDWLKTITSNISNDSRHNGSNSNNNNENNENNDNRSSVVTIFESKISSTSPTLKITKLDLRIIRTIKYLLLPLFSFIGLIAAIKQFDDNETDDDTDTSSLSASPSPPASTPTSLIIKKYTVNKNSNDISNILHRISTTSFFIILLSYMVLIAYLHLKYSNNKPIHKQLKVFILYVIGFLLLIEMAYKLFIAFSSSAYNIDQYTWIFYVFESFPELVILFVLGGLIVGEWFFINNDNLASINNNNNTIGNSSNIIHIINSSDDKDNNQNINLTV